MNNSREYEHEFGHGPSKCCRGTTSFWMHDPSHVFRELQIKSGDIFLDLGCGLGEYAIHASNLVGMSGAVYALDRSESLIAGLKRRARKEDIINITAIVADITKPLPIGDGCVDVCLVATVLHIPTVAREAKALCAEIRRVLKPHGRFAIIECHKKDLSFGPPEHMRLSPQEVEGSITHYGFEKVGLVDLGYNYLIRFAVN